jgi:hypothetical protein
MLAIKQKFSKSMCGLDNLFLDNHNYELMKKYYHLAIENVKYYHLAIENVKCSININNNLI